MSRNIESLLGMILNDDTLDDDERIAELNNVISHQNVSEQLELHGNLNFQQLSRLIKVLTHVNLLPSAKEHITWEYFKNRYEKDGNKYYEAQLLEEIIKSYSRSRYLALESLIIDALKSDSILPEQLPILEIALFSEIFTKELTAYKCRMLVRDGQKLSGQQIVQLFDLRAYDTLEFALDKKGISNDGLSEFRKPLNGEKDKRLKEKLYIKSRVLDNP